METVSAPGIGLFVPDNRNIYIGSRKSRSNYVGDMDEVKLSTFIPQPVAVVGSAKYRHQSNPVIATNTIVGFTPVIGANCKLVVAASWESSEQGIVSVMYAGESFSEAVSSDGGRQSSIWYLDLNEQSPSIGDVVVTFNAPTDSLIGVLSLDNAAPGAPIRTVSDTGSATLTLSASAYNSLAVGVYTENGNGALSSDFANTLYSGSSGSSMGNAGYQVQTAPVAYTYTWAGNGTGSAIAAAVFAPGPFLASAPSDGDTDGMDDTWEVEHFGNLGASDGSGNADGDALSDLQEFIAGTDPQDASSLFKISSVSSESISWTAVQGKTYQVRASTDLVDEESWSIQDNEIFGAPPESTYYFPTEPSKQFFKIEVE